MQQPLVNAQQQYVRNTHIQLKCRIKVVRQHAIVQLDTSANIPTPLVKRHVIFSDHKWLEPGFYVSSQLEEGIYHHVALIER